MRVWRGVFTKLSREEVLNRSFAPLPENSSEHLTLILDKILDNFSSEDDFRRLTSFSKSREVALRHAAFRGWILEVEVDAVELLDVEPFLERSKTGPPVGSVAWEQISEAQEMARQDQEVYLRASAPFRVVGVEMVGGIEIRP